MRIPPAPHPLALALALGCLVLVAFAGVLGLGFVGFDDPVYVTENQSVLAGLSWQGAQWAFRSFHGSTWLPVTWLSHQLDASLFGLDPRGHHATSLVLHLGLTLLVFHTLRRMTGRAWAAALCAALWAVHPLRVESVAWVSSRKDLLSGLAFACLLLAWLRYVEHRSAARYGLALLAMALGLAAKQVLVTAPFVLLLLDVWPLGRTSLAAPADPATGSDPASRRAPWGQLLLEKLPFLLLAAGGSWVATLSQRSGVEATSTALSFPQRAANGLIAYGDYLRQSFVPQGLSAHYPHPGEQVSMGAAGGVLALLVVLVAATLVLRRTAPALSVGLLWFLGMLVPMLGLKSFGITAARADRFTYLPHLGLAVALVYGLGPCLSPKGRRFGAGFAAAFLVTCVALTLRQTQTWSDDRSLWNNVLATAGGDATVHFNLAELRRRSGEEDLAIAHLELALGFTPEDPHVMKRLGALLAQSGRTREAAPLLGRAAQLLPDDFEAQANKGGLMVQLGDPDNGLVHLERALELDPSQDGLRLQVAQLIDNRAREAAGQKNWPEAIAQLRRADEVQPDNVSRLETLQKIQELAGRAKAAARTAERLRTLQR